jgi:hypothetical protein
MDKSKTGSLGVGLIQDRRLRADGFIVRAQSAIRADGLPAAQALRQPFDVVDPYR